MSKSLGNTVDAFEVHGPSGRRRAPLVPAHGRISVVRRGASAMAVFDEVVREFLLTLWNVYAFFVTYANAERLRPSDGDGPGRRSTRRSIAGSSPGSRETIETRTRRLGDYDATGAGRRIALFLDDLSNWYVRRARRRFWDPDGARGSDSAGRVPRRCTTASSRSRSSSRPSRRSSPRSCGGTWPRAETAGPTRCTSRTTRSSAPTQRDRDLDGAMAQRSGDRGARAPRPDRDEDQGPSAAPGGRRPHPGDHGVARAAPGADRRGAEREAGGVRGPVGAPGTWRAKPNFKVLGPRLGSRVKDVAALVGGGRRIRRVGARTGRDRSIWRPGVRIRAARPQRRRARPGHPRGMGGRLRGRDHRSARTRDSRPSSGARASPES